MIIIFQSIFKLTPKDSDTVTEFGINDSLLAENVSSKFKEKCS